MSILPTLEAPYGALQGLHEHIIAAAEPITLRNIHHLLVYPIAPLVIQAYLLQFENTRRYRIPLGIVSFYLLSAFWRGYRFHGKSTAKIGLITEPWLNAANCLLGTMVMHFVGKAVEFALLVDPVLDPYKGRGRLMSALDLCANSRWIGLRRVNVGRKVLSPGVKGHPAWTSIDESQARWLPHSSRHRTRRQAFLRHLRLAITYLLAVEALLHLLRYFSGDTAALSAGSPKSLSDTFVLFPRTSFATPAPALLVDLGIKAFVGAGVFTLLEAGYRTAATLAVGSGLYEVDVWEVDLSADPLGADSILELWGRAWHQVFRVSLGPSPAGQADKIASLPNPQYTYRRSSTSSPTLPPPPRVRPLGRVTRSRNDLHVALTATLGALPLLPLAVPRLPSRDWLQESHRAESWRMARMGLESAVHGCYEWVSYPVGAGEWARTVGVAA